MRHLALSLAALLSLSSSFAMVDRSLALDLDVASGTSGTTHNGQSFNDETRGVEVTVVGPDSLTVTSMTIRNINVDGDATVGARIYSSPGGALLASNEVAISAGTLQTVTVPISYVLEASISYRLAIHVLPPVEGSGSGTMFDPAPPSVGGFPYTEANGVLQINQSYSIVGDGYPSNNNYFVPLITVTALIVGPPFPDSGLLSAHPVPHFPRSVAWGDYDNDDDLDLLLAGRGDSTGILTLYRNEGGTAFSETTPPINLGDANTSYVQAAWGDYDNDDDLDILSAFDTTRVWRNNGDGTFDDIGASLPLAFDPTVAWGDYDNDGDQDFLVTGSNEAETSRISQVRRNNGDGTFDDVGASLIGLDNGAGDWGDYDSDGDLDILLVGTNGVGGVSRVYRNDGGGVFVDILAGLVGVHSGSAEWGDFDADGDLDILVAGIRANQDRVILISRNDGGTLASFGGPPDSPGVGRGSAAWGDCDNDGDLDILAAGHSPLGYPTAIHINNGTIFDRYSWDATLLTDAAVAWGDYDNDGDLDFAVSGRFDLFSNFLRLYRNDFASPSAPPPSPTGLSASANPSGVTFSWLGEAASLLPASGLTYNMRVGTTPGGGEVISPMSAQSGYRRVAEAGNASTNQDWSLDLPPGTYYWTVQSVDNTFAGSPFASEQSVTVGIVGAPQLLSAPTAFSLHAPRPTPFAKSASIAFEVPRAATVSLRVFDVGGRLVRTLANGVFQVGRHQVEWDGHNDDAAPAANGVYFMALESREFSAHRRLVLMR